MEKVKKLGLDDLKSTYPRAFAYLGAKKGVKDFSFSNGNLRTVGMPITSGAYDVNDLELMEKALCLE